MTALDAVARLADHKRLLIVAYHRGPVVIRWHQHKQRHTVEGSTLDVALRRAAVTAEKNVA